MWSRLRRRCACLCPILLLHGGELFRRCCGMPPPGRPSIEAIFPIAPPRLVPPIDFIMSHLPVLFQ